LGTRLTQEALSRQKIDSPELVNELLGGEMRMLRQESMRVIPLDTRYHLTRIEEVSVGSVNESIEHPREVFRPAVIASAYAVIVANVIIGERSTIESHVVIDPDVTIGSGNVIGPGAIIGTAPQDLAFSSERKTYVAIGNENVIREHCTIHRGSAEGSMTKIGDNNFLMAGAHVGHNCEIGNNIIIANNCLLGGHVRIGDGVFLGGACVFHQ